MHVATVGVASEGSGEVSTTKKYVSYCCVEFTAIGYVRYGHDKKPTGEICQYPAAMPFFLESLAAYD